MALRIGIFSNCYTPVINGVVRSISIFRQELIRQGHAVFLFAPGVQRDGEREAGIYRYPFIDVRRPFNFPIVIPFSPTLERLMVDLELDVIHSQHPALLGSTGARLARRGHIPLIFTHHSLYETYAMYLPGMQRLARTMISASVARYLAQCQRIIAPSASLHEIIAAQHPHLAYRMVTLPTPLDLGLYDQPDAEPVRRRYGLSGNLTLVTVSRMAPEKNLDLLLESFALATRDRDDVRLLVVGDGPACQDVRRKAEGLRLDHRVIWAGAVPFGAVPSHLAAADLFVSAATHETQGLAILEGMAAGLPVVAVDAMGNRDVARDGENGLLPAPRVEPLAAAMRRLIEDGALRARMAETARATAESYGAPAVTRRLVAIYQEAITESKVR